MASPSVAVLPIVHRYSRSDGLTVDISYRYDAVTPQVSTLSIPYGYEVESGSYCPALVGHWDDHTQRLANKLPMWHVGRRGGHRTNYQKLINSFGQTCGDIHTEMLYGRSNLYVDTVDSFQVDHIYSSNLDFAVGAGKETGANLLSNSDFSLPGKAREQLPDAWSSMRGLSTANVTNTGMHDSVAGGNCITIEADTGQVGYLRQVVRTDIPANQDLTVSAWIKVPVDTGQITTGALDASQSSLSLSVIAADGTTEYTDVALPQSTHGNWKRVYATLQTTKPVFQLACTVRVDAISLDRNHIVAVDAVQVEYGSFPSSWTDNLNDGPPWLTHQTWNPSGPLDVHVVMQTQTGQALIDTGSHQYVGSPKKRLSYVDDIEDFTRFAIPTSFESMDSGVTPPVTTSTKQNGMYTDSGAVSWKVLWRVDPTDDSKIQRYLQGPGDILGTYDIAERNINQWIDNTYTVPSNHFDTGEYDLKIRDFTIYANNIWAICQETWQSDISYSLKIINPKTFRSINYLEVINDIPINGNATDLAALESTSGPFTIANIDGDPKQILLSTSTGSPDTHFAVNLNYDYYMVAEDKGQVLTRHAYTGDLVMT